MGSSPTQYLPKASPSKLLNLKYVKLGIYGCFPKIGGKTPKWIVKIMVPNPIRIPWIWGVLPPLFFGLTPISGVRFRHQKISSQVPRCLIFGSFHDQALGTEPDILAETSRQRLKVVSNTRNDGTEKNERYEQLFFQADNC